MGPSCCVCGEVYVPEPGSDEVGRGGGGGGGGDSIGGGDAHGPSLRRGAGGGAGGGSGEESFVVLPDSTPVLSEDYFTLARNQTHHRTSSSSSATGGLGVASSSSSGLSYNALGGSANPKAGTDATTMAGLRVAGGLSSGGPSLAPGSELLESRYSGYGGSGGFGGGWTGSGFGVGSSMLDSIVQISHAGLSDNVRRESLLYELSKRPAWCRSSSGGGLKAVGVGGDERGGHGGGGEEREEEEHDPTLCCHCYASLLEQIDEDSRLADREVLAYRDFVGLLDGISAESGLESSGNTKRTSALPAAAAPTNVKTNEDGDGQAADSTTGCSEGEEVTDDDAADDAAQEKSPRRHCNNTREGRDEAGNTRKEKVRNRRNGNPRSSSSSSRRAQQQQQGEDEDDDQGEGTAESSPSSFSQALRIAQQTSVQLRAELRSLETQREGLCARGSAAWAALSELAYARGVLGEECRELLRDSREVCA